MKSIVEHLLTMVGGAGNDKTVGDRPRTGKIEEVLYMTPNKLDKGKAEAQHCKSTGNPEKVIPLDNEDFRDF